MLRIFGHFVPLPALALGLCELLLLCTAFYLVNAPMAATHLEIQPVPAQLAFGIAALALVAMTAVGLYHHEVFLDGRLMAIKVGAAFLLVAPAVAAIGIVYSRAAAGDVHWASWALKASVAWVALVMVTRAVFLKLVNSALFRRPVLVIGTGVRARRIAELVARGENHSFAVAAYVHAAGDLRLVMGSGLDLDRSDDDYALSRFAAQSGAREVVVATDERRGMPVAQLLHCKIAGVNVVDYLTFWERATRKVELESLQPSWLIYSDGFRQGVVIDAAKRALDLAVSAILLAFVVPVLLAAFIAIKLDDRGPVFYRQERIGRFGRCFTLLKLRTMRADAEYDGTPQWARNGDPRVTRIGLLLRRFRVDELPQLINVLEGSMSFVGPRPERPYFVAEIAKSVPFYRERHSVKPGITGWAQVNFPYGASLDDARQKLGYDLYYVKNRTLFLDILILLQTVRVILFHEGAR